MWNWEQSRGTFEAQLGGSEGPTRLGADPAWTIARLSNYQLQQEIKSMKGY